MGAVKSQDLNSEQDVSAVSPAGSMESRLRESEAHLEKILETLVDGVITIDERGIIQLANPAAERIFGYAKDTLVGKNVSLLMPGPDRSAHDGYLAKYLKTGQANIIGFGREVLGQRKDGSTFPLELAISELQTEHGRLFTGITRDVSERKQAEAEIRQANEILTEYAYAVRAID
ncbi:MAG: PAS domain S-box protein [Rhodospirillales bacterium]